MKKIFSGIILIMLLIFSLAGCKAVGCKEMNISSIYGVTAVLSLLTLICYCLLIRKKDNWFLLLFVSVFVVNIGYFCLGISKTLEEALLANRISYLGSVFLPLSMYMIILNVSKLSYKKWVPGILFVVSMLVFLVAATPGYLDIYYKTVTLEKINGVSVLIKEYGPWHSIYLFYLVGYFLSMVATIHVAIFKKKIESTGQSVVLVMAVMVNIGVWLLEQLVSIEFEFLSVSYIISELFLIGLYVMIQNQEKMMLELKDRICATESRISATKTTESDGLTNEFAEHCSFLREHLPTLTATERTIYDLYLDGKGTKDVMKELNISENTLKYHNKNIYGKLGVSSRKQMLEYARYEQK